MGQLQKKSHGDAGHHGNEQRKVRYAVVGLGHISQVAVLPAFAQAENSELVALFSNDDAKLKELGERYQIEHCLKYEEYDRFLSKGLVDAVYISLPNHLHCDYTLRAARQKVNVLCEKPMAVTEEECERMIAACDENNVRLMIAYRLHFERANLEAIEIARSGELGDVRLFDSVFSQSIKQGDIRLMPLEKGGGSVYDMGVYCINAARYLFRDEPTEVMAFSESRPEARYAEADEMTSAVLRFPGNRIATFTSSFGATDVSTYRLVGTKGTLTMDPAYEYAMSLEYKVDAGLIQRKAQFAKRDQFSPELLHFSNCILEQKRPEPDGYEGLADVRIVQAIYESARTGRSVRLSSRDFGAKPSLRQVIDRPGIEKPAEFKVSGPSAN